MGDPARGARGAGRRVACAAGLIRRQDRPGGLPLPGSRTWYTPADAAALFEALDRLDANARAVCAATGLTIDMVFPAACGLLFAILPVCLFRAPFFLLPLATAAADVLVNATIAACLAGGGLRRWRPLAVGALALTGRGRPSPERSRPRGGTVAGMAIAANDARGGATLCDRRRQYSCGPFHSRMPPRTARHLKRPDCHGIPNRADRGGPAGLRLLTGHSICRRIPICLRTGTVQIAGLTVLAHVNGNAKYPDAACR